MSSYVLRDGTPEERALSASERLDRIRVRVIEAMVAAGLNDREQHVYWLHEGSLTSFGDIAEMMPALGKTPAAAKVAAHRAFTKAEAKLSLWVSIKGFRASPLYRSMDAGAVPAGAPVKAHRGRQPRMIADGRPAVCVGVGWLGDVAEQAVAR